jgi:hypothetical protein
MKLKKGMRISGGENGDWHPIGLLVKPVTDKMECIRRACIGRVRKN